MRMRMRMRDSASITCLIGRLFDSLIELSFSCPHENGAFFQDSDFRSWCSMLEQSQFCVACVLNDFLCSVKQRDGRKQKRLKCAFLRKRKYSVYANICIVWLETIKKPLAGLLISCRFCGFRRLSQASSRCARVKPKILDIFYLHFVKIAFVNQILQKNVEF